MAKVKLKYNVPLKIFNGYIICDILVLRLPRSYEPSLTQNTTVLFRALKKIFFTPYKYSHHLKFFVSTP